MEIERSTLLLLDELQGLLFRHHVDRAGLVPEADAVALLRHVQHLRAEGRADELAVGGLRDGLEHLRHGGPVLGVEVGVDLVEEVERGRVAGLNGED